MKGENKNINQEQNRIDALNKMKKIMEEELDYIDLDLTSDFVDFLKKKVEKHNSKTLSLDKINKQISHESQVTFLIDNGIKLEECNNDILFLMDNYHCVEFYGVQYLIQINDYKEEQDVYNYLISSNLVDKNVINQAG